MNDESMSQEANVAVVRPEGDLVAPALPPVRSQLREMVGAGIRHLTLDLAGTRIVDSAGIGLLIAVHNSLKKVGGELTVIHVSEEVLELFRTMRMHQHFSVSGN
jgi:anti-anti-sigma factor